MSCGPEVRFSLWGLYKRHSVPYTRKTLVVYVYAEAVEALLHLVLARSVVLTWREERCGVGITGIPERIKGTA